jgi:glycosyltransferase involved in cell wall biosynthesis
MGGAEKIARALHDGARAAGHESWMAVGRKTTGDANVFALDHDRLRTPWSKLCRAAAAAIAPVEGVKGMKLLRLVVRDTVGQPRRAARRRGGEEDFDFPATAGLLGLPPAMPDLLHLHNLHSPAGYFDLRELPRLSARVPTVVTLHDAWLLAGHCAHSFGCDRWQTGCGRCPDLSIYPPIRKDATAFNWGRKRDLFARSRLRVCTPSQWLMDRVARSMLQPAVVDARVIPNGVDLSVFCPGDRAAARAGLDLPQDARVLLFAANGIRSNPFKDFRTMREAITAVASDAGARGSPLLFVALGEPSPDEVLSENATLRFVPFLTDESTIARYYQAADVYLHPARADTFPTTVLEALACGRPVIASDVGGIPEQVGEGETGHLVPVGDAGGMAAAIIALLRDGGRRLAMGARAAEVARARFDARRHVEATLDWYRQIVSPAR